MSTFVLVPQSRPFTTVLRLERKGVRPLTSCQTGPGSLLSVPLYPLLNLEGQDTESTFKTSHLVSSLTKQGRTLSCTTTPGSHSPKPVSRWKLLRVSVVSGTCGPAGGPFLISTDVYTSGSLCRPPPWDLCPESVVWSDSWSICPLLHFRGDVLGTGDCCGPVMTVKGTVVGILGLQWWDKDL